MSAEVWLGALQLCLQPSVILFLCIGVCIGTVIGALPGLSATMGIAIMTPSPSGLSRRTASPC